MPKYAPPWRRAEYTEAWTKQFGDRHRQKKFNARTCLNNPNCVAVQLDGRVSINHYHVSFIKFLE